MKAFVRELEDEQKNKISTDTKTTLTTPTN